MFFIFRAFNKMFKKILFQFHWFLGISAGLILSIMGVTGAIYSYESQILKWINQDSYVVKAENREKLTPEQLFTHFNQNHPEIKINSISISADPTKSSIVNIAKEGERRGYNMMVNPYSAEILPALKGRDFFNSVQSLHRWLTVGKIGDREIGKQITGAATLMLIFFVLSGLYLRWPRKHSIRQWFVFKRELSGKNFLWDLHAVAGTWVAIFYLLLAMTGLYWSYDWWRNGMFKVLGVDRPAPTAQHQNNNQTNGNKLPQDQIPQILATTWTNATAKIGREYSTITLNIPKVANGKIDLSYVDPIPQHERARNSVVFDYSNNQIIKHEIYENKKLNEKIMSSMLPVHRGSFFGGLYQFFVMIAALSMPLFFITGWMLYFKRRKQQQLTKDAMLLATQHTKQNQQLDKADWTIVYATQSGTAEQLAWQTATSLQKANLSVKVQAIQDLTENDLLNQQQILFIASTFGTGEAPDLATNFANHMMQQQLDLSQLNFAVLALGSREYDDTFCLFGNQLAGWLESCGAQPLFETINVNNADPNDIQLWNKALSQITQQDLEALSLDKTFHTWTLQKRECLNPNTLGQPAYYLTFNTNKNVSWNPGDIAEIKPANSKQRIQQFLDANQLEAHTQTNVGTLNQALLYKNLTKSIAKFRDINELVKQLDDLPHREYSIANTPQSTQSQQLELVVRQHKDENNNLGLGSGWLTEYLDIGQPIQIHLRKNPAFALIDDHRPIICIGNGTGIAGLMSLIEARENRQHFDNWLIWGERQRTQDFFFQNKLENWLQSGVLAQLDVAFSRDQAEKVYVQHLIIQSAEKINDWVQNGAVIYVCGSLNGMASDVDQALKNVLGENKMNEMIQNQRYRRDVY